MHNIYRYIFKKLLQFKVLTTGEKGGIMTKITVINALMWNIKLRILPLREVSVGARHQVSLAELTTERLR